MLIPGDQVAGAEILLSLEPETTFSIVTDTCQFQPIFVAASEGLAEPTGRKALEKTIEPLAPGHQSFEGVFFSARQFQHPAGRTGLDLRVCRPQKGPQGRQICRYIASKQPSGLFAGSEIAIMQQPF